MDLEEQLRGLLQRGELSLPAPGSGRTAVRLQRLAEFGRQDVALSRLVEAHVDAVAILEEGGRAPAPGKLYGVWASETRNSCLSVERGARIRGTKAFCSGATMVDRALVTVRDPEELLVEVDLRDNASGIAIHEDWIAPAFVDTGTATVGFHNVRIVEVIGTAGWYLTRTGFWHGACGPAACWAGGAQGLWDYCGHRPRENAHDTANQGAIYSAVWAAQASLRQAGNEIDANPADAAGAKARALALRHQIDEGCSDILRRFAHIYGPRALAFDAVLAKRYQEVQLYIRQCHAERDLEILGHVAMENAREPQRCA